MAHRAPPLAKPLPPTHESGLLTRVTSVLHRIIGVPDYERYVAHMQSHHPDAPLLSCEDFQRERLADRYSKPGSRCC